MAPNTSKCNHLTPLCFKGLIQLKSIKSHSLGFQWNSLHEKLFRKVTVIFPYNWHNVVKPLQATNVHYFTFVYIYRYQKLHSVHRGDRQERWHHRNVCGCCSHQHSTVLGHCRGTSLSHCYTAYNDNNIIIIIIIIIIFALIATAGC